MKKVKCEICREMFYCPSNKYYFLCKKCYKKHYLPVKEEWTISGFRDNIKNILIAIEKKKDDFWRSCGLDL